MKLLVALFCVAFVVSVPVSEVPSKPSTPAAVADAPVAEPATKPTEVKPTEAKTAEVPVTEVKTEAPKTEAPQAETKVETPAVEAKTPAATETKTEVVAPAATETKTEAPKVEAKTETPAAPVTESKTEAPKVAEADDSLKQIVNVVEKLASSVQGEDHKSLVALMQSGMDIIAEAEKRAREIQSKIESQNLLQADNMFGVKEDGTIDAKAAADQITNLVNIFVGPNTVTDKDKEMLHTMIDTVSQVLTPLMNPNTNGAPALPSAQAIESLMKLVMPPTDNKQNELVPSAQAIEALMKLMVAPSTDDKAKSKDALLQPETLLSLFDDKSEFDVNALGDLANKFIQTFEASLEEAEKQ